jgi:hypothetical protein
VVNTILAGDQKSIGLDMTRTTGVVAVSFEGPGVSTDAFARVFTTYAAPTSYCTAKINSLGCSPAISTQGSPSLSATTPLRVTASAILNQKSGLLFWGRMAASLPYYGGTLCVQFPISRTPVQQSGGSAAGQDCSGNYLFEMSSAYLLGKGLTTGDSVYAQWWYRDPGSPGALGVGLTNAISFDITP